MLVFLRAINLLYLYYNINIISIFILSKSLGL